MRTVLTFYARNYCKFVFVSGIYGFIYLPLNLTSFDINANSTYISANSSAIHYFPIVIFNILQFLGNFGVGSIPNMMMCEVFPFKSKAFATGLVITIYYFSMFIASKTFYILEILLTLPGIGILYGCIGVVGYAIVNYLLNFQAFNDK